MKNVVFVQSFACRIQLIHDNGMPEEGGMDEEKEQT